MDESRRNNKRGRASFAVTYRVLDPIEARLDFGEAEREAIAEDLSVGGLSLSTSHPIEEGATVVVKFRALDKGDAGAEKSSKKFELRGETRYSRHTKENYSFRIGLRFKKLSEAEKQFIESCL